MLNMVWTGNEDGYLLQLSTANPMEWIEG